MAETGGLVSCYNGHRLFMATFSDYHQAITKYLLESLDETQKQLGSPHSWTEDVFTRLKQFTPMGKLLRGSLVLLAAESFGQTHESDQSNALKIAAAMELFQAAILIHDDIIDQDSLRRGQPSFHRQYQLLAQEKGLAQPQHTGESLALCVGDIGLFLAFDQLAQLEIPLAELQKIQRLFLREVTRVGLAEMDDVRITLTSEAITQAEIESMYIYKTGRYSIYLPLALGALLSGATPETLAQLEKFGETLGLLFQIKDDELGLFGSEKETGKPVTSDAREGKKTLYYYWLVNQAQPEVKARFLTLWGNPSCDEADMVEIRSLVTESGAQQKVEARLQELQTTARTLFEQLPLKPEMKSLWTELITLNSQRKK